MARVDALSRDGHPVAIVGRHTEEGIEFAWVKYLDGHLPGPVGGRVAGTEDDPVWEHRMLDGRVLKPGPGRDYYNDADWTTEKGLQLRG